MAGKVKTPVKIIGERDIELYLCNPNHHDHITKIGKALSSPIRLNILNLLRNTALSLQEIADLLHIPVSSTALHIKTLEDARLIVTETQPGLHGSMRVSTCSLQSFHLETFDAEADIADNTITLDMPIGNYHSFEIEPTCGLADENGILDVYDNIRSFYSPLRTRAQLLWFQQGYIEYRFPNLSNPLLPLQEIAFQMEICSEAPGFLENWPSDITISINNKEITTYCSPGDFGSRRGRLTPSAWPSGRTQYGLLKIFSVKTRGGYLDGLLTNPEIGLADLNLQDHPYISLKIQIKKDAQHIGGINIFGEKYGDYPHGIVMNLVY
ncbi:MAG: helix-turn-helix domain-containing protein [Hungatella sp.]|jgi:predicted transcriptional regulator|nr:helix-turn-helix domain-containing protein [Hungatella sp.]